MAGTLVNMENTPERRRRGSRFDSLEQEAYLSLWRTYDRLRAIEDDLFAKYDLSAQQYNALRLLRSVHPDSMATLMLGSRLISRAPDMTRLVDRLEKRNLVQRARRSNNRRVVDVAITEQGLALLEELANQVRISHEKQLGHLSQKTLRDLIGLLHEARLPHEDADSLWRSRG